MDKIVPSPLELFFQRRQINLLCLVGMSESRGLSILQDSNGGLIVLNKDSFDRLGQEQGYHAFAPLLATNELEVSESLSNLHRLNIVVGLVRAVDPEECLARPLPIDRVVALYLPVILFEVNDSFLQHNGGTRVSNSLQLNG